MAIPCFQLFRPKNLGVLLDWSHHVYYYHWVVSSIVFHSVVVVARNLSTCICFAPLVYSQHESQSDIIKIQIQSNPIPILSFLTRSKTHISYNSYEAPPDLVSLTSLTLAPTMSTTFPQVSSVRGSSHSGPPYWNNAAIHQLQAFFFSCSICLECFPSRYDIVPSLTSFFGLYQMFLSLWGFPWSTYLKLIL